MINDLIKLWGCLTKATKDLYILIASAIFGSLFFPWMSEILKEENVLLYILYSYLALIIAIFLALVTSILMIYILNAFKRWWKE